MVASFLVFDGIMMYNCNHFILLTVRLFIFILVSIVKIKILCHVIKLIIHFKSDIFEYNEIVKIILF
jgi:hypothetical protein